MNAEIVSFVIETVYKVVIIVFVLVTTNNWKVYNNKIRELEKQIQYLKSQTGTDLSILQIGKDMMLNELAMHRNILKHLVKEKGEEK